MIPETWSVTWNVSSRLSPQWLCGNSCTWTNEPKCMSCHKAIVVMTGRVHCFYNIYVMYYAHLASVRFEHSVSWITYYRLYKYIYIYIYEIKCNWGSEGQWVSRGNALGKLQYLV